MKKSNLLKIIQLLEQLEKNAEEVILDSDELDDIMLYSEMTNFIQRIRYLINTRFSQPQDPMRRRSEETNSNRGLLSGGGRSGRKDKHK